MDDPFDYFIDRRFSHDSQGKTIFFRWGYSSYHILPNAKKEAEVRSFLKNYYLFFIGASVVIVGIGGLWGILLAIIISSLWYYLETERLLKGLEKGSW